MKIPITTPEETPETETVDRGMEPECAPAENAAETDAPQEGAAKPERSGPFSTLGAVFSRRSQNAAALEEYERRLYAREQELNQKGRELAIRQDMLDQKERELDACLQKKEQELEVFIQELKERKQALEQEDRALAAYRQRLEDREKQLAQKDRAITAYADETAAHALSCEKQQAALDEAGRAFAAEKAFFEEQRTPFDCGAAEALAARLGEIVTQFRSTADCFKALSPEIQALTGTARDLFSTSAYTELARFCRTLEQDDDPNVRRLAEPFAMILQLDLRLEKICPAQGDPYVPGEHLRADGTPTGGTVARTLSPGWKKNGAVFLPALTKTCEG